MLTGGDDACQLIDVFVFLRWSDFYDTYIVSTIFPRRLFMTPKNIPKDIVPVLLLIFEVSWFILKILKIIKN